jgi:hypothetical protein
VIYNYYNKNVAASNKSKCYKKWLNNIIFCYRLIYNKNLYQFQQKLQTIITTNHVFFENGKNGQQYFVYYILIATKTNNYFNKKYKSLQHPNKLLIDNKNHQLYKFVIC